jgi:RHS repeat-associated protein
VKTYIYANSQIIAQHTGDHEADRYFYLHDRLGSVRQVIDTSGDVVHLYTYEPFGEVLESDSAQGAPSNAFMFTGQYFDSEIDQYYLRARQYDPHIARFTARDPVFGEFEEPLTLHVYLYCLNDPMNGVDPRGEFISLPDLSISQGISLTMRGWQAYTYTTKAYNFVQRIFEASDLRQVLIITASFAIDMGTDYAAGKMFDSAMRGLKKVSLSLSGNKLNHIFGKAAHKLGPLLKHFGGSRELAGDAIEKAFQEAVESGVYAGQDLTKGIAISVAGELVVVRGEIVDGIARVGTVFIP